MSGETLDVVRQLTLQNRKMNELLKTNALMLERLQSLEKLVTLKVERYISVKDASNMTGLSPTSIITKINEGKIKGCKRDGVRYLIPLTSMQRYFDNLKIEDYGNG